MNESNETYLKYETHGEKDIHYKAKIYFVCTPEDYEKYYDSVANDFFALQDVAIFVRKDFSESFPESDKEIELSRMNLFVVFVSENLFESSYRGWDEDCMFAKEHQITVLPILLDDKINLLSYANRFGDIQYLDRNDLDNTAIPYRKKLESFLNKKLFTPKLVEDIKNTFRSYIFLSYRKKDKYFANEFMKTVHENENLLDVAIWYDEFLEPSEKFTINIEKALDKSSVFSLLVTPSLLELNDAGKKNYVCEIEYPLAVSKNKEVLGV